MIRAFTISFEFEGKTYLALASMKSSEQNDISYSIRVYDDALARIIPDKKLTYSNNKRLCPSSLKHPQALRLFTCISDAVNCHVAASKVDIRQISPSTIH